MSATQTLVTAPQSPRRRRIEQVHTRDPLAEGEFWYSVVTTGVYCRPTCPSRKARPEHIRFHDTLAEARRTGFRPCRRCCPEEPALQDRHRDLVETICNEALSAAQRPTLKTLSAAACLSPSHFHRLFKQVTGLTPGRYFEVYRRPSVAPRLV